MRRVPGLLIVLGALTTVAVLHQRGGLRTDLVGRALVPLLHIEPRILCLIVSINLLSLFLAGALWTRLARTLGYRLPFRVGLAAYLSAGIGGYLLSAAGPAVGCALAVRRCGFPAGRAVLLSVLANTLGFCGLLVWAPLGLLALGRAGVADQVPALHGHGVLVLLGPFAGLLLGMLLVLRMLAAAPTARNRLVRRLLSSDSDVDGPAVGTMQIVALVPWAAVTCLAGAITLYLGLGALSPIAAQRPLVIIGAAELAGTLGSLAFFVPQGLGVQDTVLVTLLAHAAGLPVAQNIGVILALRLLDPAIKVGLLLVLVVVAHARRSVRSPGDALASRAVTAQAGVGQSVAPATHRRSDARRSVDAQSPRHRWDVAAVLNLNAVPP